MTQSVEQDQPDQARQYMSDSVSCARNVPQRHHMAGCAFTRTLGPYKIEEKYAILYVVHRTGGRRPSIFFPSHVTPVSIERNSSEEVSTTLCVSIGLPLAPTASSRSQCMWPVTTQRHTSCILRSTAFVPHPLLLDDCGACSMFTVT